MNSYEWKTKWKLIIILLIIIVVMALCMYP